MEEINDPSMPPTATRMRTVVLLLVSSCLSTAIGLATLIDALAPASVAAPSRMQSAPCSISAVWPESHMLLWSRTGLPLAQCPAVIA
jgi:hypothetical protein